MDGGSENGIEGEVVRVEAVRYLDGPVGHAVGSMVFVVAGSVFWVTGAPSLGGYVLAIAFLVSANGLSIWAWTRLQTYFAARTQTRETAETRTLKAQPIGKDSIVALKTGAVMVPSLVVLLLVGLGAVQLLGLLVAGLLFVVVLVLGNLAAIANAVYG
jgi:hypothetical protein